MKRLIGCLLLMFAVACPGVAAADPVPKGAEWSEATFPSTDGTILHADILRPKGLPEGVRTPVLMVAGPYNGHNGFALTPGATHDGPVAAYPDILDRVRFFERGWLLVLVDLRGYGGSAGCPDWSGPGEREDVKAAVEWAASQPWSTGRVGLFGLSYEGSTGVMGLATRPKGLAAAVIGNAPTDAYRWSYSHGIRQHHSIVSPPGYFLYEVQPGTVNDSPDYISRALANPACTAAYTAGNQMDSADDPFWVARRNGEMARGTTTPLFLSQGLLDFNVRPDESVFDLWSGAAGPRKAWFGQYAHIFPSSSDAEMTGFDQAVFRFLDHHVRGVALADAPTDRDPDVVIGANDGTWRGDRAWPPADVRMFRTALRTGEYVDSGENAGTALIPLTGDADARTPTPTGKGLWTISAPLAHEAHLSGLPELSVDATTLVPGANFVADLYDIDAHGKATLITREGMLLRASGTHALTLHAQDWRLPAGHRLGVLLTWSNNDYWVHRPSGAQVMINEASIDLPMRTLRPPGVLETKPPGRLKEYLKGAGFPVEADIIAEAETAFALPGPLGERPAAQEAGAPGTTAPTAPAAAGPSLPRLTVGAGAKRRRVTAIGNAPTGARVRVRLLHGKRVVARRTVVARHAAWRATLRATRRGTYRVSVTTTVDGTRLRARSKRVRVR